MRTTAQPAATPSRKAPSTSEVDAAIHAWRREVAAWRVFAESMASRAEVTTFAALSATVAKHEARVDGVLAAHRSGAVTLTSVFEVVTGATSVIAVARIAAEGLE